MRGHRQHHRHDLDHQRALHPDPGVEPAAEQPTAKGAGRGEDRVAEHLEETPAQEQRDIDRAQREQRRHRIGVEHPRNEEFHQLAIMGRLAQGAQHAPRAIGQRLTPTSG